MSRRRRPGPSASHGLQAADVYQHVYQHALIESFDELAPLRNNLKHLSKKVAEWAGIPIPLQDLPLVVEPNYPIAEVYNAERDDSVPEGMKVRNTFYSKRYRTSFVVWEEDGRIRWGPLGRSHHVDQLVATMAASGAWGIKQEQQALHTLGTLIRHHPFKTYLMTGMFMERSKRSGILYVFRKLRPTIALSMGGTWSWKKPGIIGHEDHFNILCTLCLHPIGYYENSWAGAMCPTDDVIAHLMLMRGDEAMFWRRSHQHQPERAESGI